MREILFRGKSVETGEWICGWYCEASFGRWPLCPSIADSEKARCGEFGFCEIVPETVCQFTGLCDKNGTKVFEGDIIQNISFDETVYYGVVRFGKYNTPFREEETNVGFFLEWVPDFAWRRDLAHWTEKDYIEIVGNIYDNPELLEVE